MNNTVQSQAGTLPLSKPQTTWWLSVLLMLLTLLVLLLPGLTHAAVPDVPLAGAYIEAEDYQSMGAANPWAWNLQSSVSGHQGTGYLYTTVGGTGTQPNGSRIDFPVNFLAGGNYRMWLRARDASPSGNGDSTFWGIDGVVMGALTEARVGGWEWTTRLQNGTNVANITAGNHVINLWPREPGQHTDSIFIIGSSQSLPGNVFEGSTAGVPTGHTALDFSGAGPGAGYITIPDGQSINGGPISMLDTTGGGTPGSQEIEYQTDLSSLQYRALGGQSDGFPGFALDSKWTKTDVGNDGTSAPTVNDGTLTLIGAGADIWNTRDFFSYLYQSGISGDFTIDVKVASQQNTNAWAKAGIMVRQSLASNSRHAMVVVTPSNGVRIQSRATDGASSQNPTAANATSAPQWLRFVRSGNNFTAFKSSDGLSWTAVAGSATVVMSDPVYIGLAVTSHSSGNPSTVTFENFHFMPASTSGMSTSWSAASGSITTTGWTDGDYALALNSGTTFETNTFNYVDCIDGTVSSITIPGSQTVQGSSVSLPGLYSTAGNVTNFTYQINGGTVNSPWNSLAYGSGGPEAVSLSVFGTDPDCGGSLVSATQNISVDNSCSDPTPSTLTILTGQSTGGGAVDLTALVTQSGNVASLTYKINGVTIGTPTAWDSTGYGSGTAESVTFEVSGTDPECGGSTITAINTIEVDNTCTRNPPSISFNKDVNYVGAGKVVPYDVTIRNEDSFNCGSSTFDVAISVDPVNGNFVASYFNPVGSNNNITLAGRESTTIELAVEATSGATEWAEKDTTLEITSNYTGDSNVHNTPKTTGTITTKVFLVSPITHNSVTTASSKWNGSWGTSETVANSGVDSKYGNFDCLICHVKDGANIKWMREEIQLPGADWGTGTTIEHLPITFQDARESGDWGNDDPSDDGSGRTSSVKPCEVCHTITLYHRYNTNADPADPPEGAVGAQSIVQGETHFPDRDCIDCHRHSLGFTASCIGCHGDPPLEATLGGPNGLADIPDVTGSVTPGTHYKHYVVLNYDCEYCHAGWRTVGEMPKLEPNSGKYQINHTFAVFGSAEAAATAGQYTGQDGVNYEPVADLITRGVQDANGTVQPGQGTMTCENIYCHGGTDNMGGTNPQWNGNISCNSCHGTSGTNTPPGYSHTTHVGDMGIACTICHGASTGLGANGHVNGDVHIDLTELRSGYPNSSSAVYNGVGGTANGAKWDSGRLAPSDPDVTDGSDLYGTCSNVACHFGVDTPVWNNNNQPATCTICHNDGTDDGTLDHSAPSTGAHAQHRGATLMAQTFIDQCQSCHGGGANAGNHTGHVDFDADFAANVTWNSGNRNCTNTCHEGDYATNLWDSVSDLNCDACHKTPYLGPTVVDPNNGGAGMDASGYGSHLKAAKTESFSGSTDWDTQCKKCHPYHASGAGIVDIALPTENWTAASGTASDLNGENMRSKLGLDFPITGTIHLGGASTSGSTEADMCWNCHGADTEINEWGYNYDSNGTLPYTKLKDIDNNDANSHHYGWMYENSNWTTMTSAWVDSSGNGYYRKDGYQHSTETTPSYVSSRRISSVHSVNFTIGSNHGSSIQMNVDGSGNVIRTDSQTLETPGEIRCSYCHDVHDMNRAVLSDGVTNESATGRPFLRGTWFGNPYAADIPPIDSYTYPITGGPGVGQRFRKGTSTSIEFFDANAVPRLFTSLDIQSKGGYFLDQNSNWPMSGKNADLSDTAGICVLCHGNDVNNMDYYDTNSIWRDAAGNGHANSTIGGSGAGHANARNIFDGRRGASAATGMYMAGQDGVNRLEYGDLTTIKDSGPYWNEFDRAARDSAAQSPPRNTGWYGGTAGSTSRGSQYSTWYSGNTSLTNTASIGTNASTARAHDFSCSKCHSPHATGLPALLITNCLDYKVSNWDRTANSSVVKGPKATNSFAVRSQNNCHRNESASTGWHKLNTAQ